MRCRAARKRLSAYTDGALALYEMVALKEHLSACPACRSELGELRLLNQLLAQRAAPAPDINWTVFEATVQRRLARQRVNIWASPWYRQTKVWRTGMAAAAVVLLVVGAGVWLDGGLRSNVEGPFQASTILPPEADTTLRYESHGQFQMVTQVVSRRASPPSAITPPTAAVSDEALRLAWLAGTDRPWPADGANRVTVQYDDPRGKSVEHHYHLLRPAPH